MLYDARLALRGISVRKSTDAEDLAALEEFAPCNVGTCSDTPSIIVQHGSAGNDPAISEDDAEPCAPHALAANGYGDLAITDTAASARPTSYELHQAARAHRAFVLGGIIVPAIRAAAAIARSAYTRHRQRRRASAIYDALHQLDDRTLHDMGFDRSEISSVAAEVAGEAESTRVRAIALAETPDRRYWTAYDHFMFAREVRAMRRVYLHALAARWRQAARGLFAWNAAS